MGRISRIEQVINSPLSSGHMKILPRGLPRFVDPLLRGTPRFAKRTGNTISILNPDNTFNFETPPRQRDPRIVMQRPSVWFTEGAIVSVGPGKELHEIDDVSDNILFLKENIVRTYTDQDKLLLHSFPMLIAIDAPPGATEVVVKSHYDLANGDVFAYLQTEGLLQSLDEIRITKVVSLGTTTNLFFTKLFSIELESPIQGGRTLISNETVYQRAFPGYFSAEVRVPNSLFSSDPIGPFLIDHLSGRLIEGRTFRETLSVRTRNRTGNTVFGTPNSFETVPKNFVVADRPLSSHFPMFWELAEGTMRLTPDRLIMRVNSLFQFVVGTKCIPPLPTGNTWRFTLKSNEDCSVRVFFRPNDFQEFLLTSNVSTSVTVNVPAGDDITDIEINVLGSSEITQVEMTDWSVVGSTVETIEYNIVSEAIGQSTYQSTGLILKSYFLGSEFLRTEWDSGDKFDGGKVYF